ncbi:MAG: histidine kinase [Leifsonia sp.]
MSETPPAPGTASTGPPPALRSRARRAWGLVGSIALSVLCALLSISAAGIHGGDTSTFPPPVKLLADVGAWAMIAVSVLLVWRHRFPVPVSLVAVAGALVFPTTPLPALVALAAVTAVTAGWRRWALVAATYLAVLVALCWDVASHVSLLSDFVGEPAEGTPARLALFWAVPLVAAVAVAPFAGFGFGRSLLAERDAAAAGTVAANRNVAVLHREVERERERQELARELHDTLAARLSSLSLHAGALELTVGETDQKAAEAARVVRETAQSSLDELRDVVQVLRRPAGGPTGTGLADISRLVDDVVRDGADVRAQVFVSDPAMCDPDIAHASYRIVQESLSNARRHAPGTAIRLEVRGGPESGVSISTTNWLAPGVAPTSVGGGHGLAGMSERVALAGGAFQAGATAEGTFAVLAWLPWTPRQVDAAG